MKNINLLLFLTLFSSSVFAENPESGWWWNSDESGRGFTIENQGNTIFFAAYLYDDSGFPTWYTSVLKKNAQRGFTGILQQFKGGQILTGQYQKPIVMTENAGEINLDFQSPKKGTLSWPGGTMLISRFIFGADTANAPATNTPAANTAVQRGADLFNINCSNSTCHGVNPALNQNSILEGRNANGIRSAFVSVRRMIGAGLVDRVTDSEIKDLAAYLRSLNVTNVGDDD